MPHTCTQLPLLTGPVRVKVMMVREEGNPVPEVIRTPLDSSRYADALRDSDREVFAVILLNSRNGALGLHVCSVGTIDTCLVAPANIFRPAILAAAAGVILLHTHPSGDATPSAQDIRITQQIIEAGKTMGIPVLDHVILGRNVESFSSLRESGIVTF